jgi:hypothetical protein
MSSDDAIELARRVVERDTAARVRRGRDRALVAGFAAPIAGVILATMAVEPLWIVAAAGAVPFVGAFLARATAQMTFGVPLFVVQVIALVMSVGCTAAMAEADSANEQSFQRIWLLSVLFGSLVGSASGIALGAWAARLGGPFAKWAADG